MKKILAYFFVLVLGAAGMLFFLITQKPDISPLHDFWAAQSFQSGASGWSGDRPSQTSRRSRGLSQQEAQAQALTEATTMINGVLEDIAEVAERHGAARTLIVQTRAEVEGGRRVRSFEEEIDDYLSAISARLRYGDERLESLKAQLSTASGNVAELRETIQTLERTIKTYEQDLDNLRRESRRLRGRIATLERENQKISQENRGLEREVRQTREEAEQLRDAYYIAGPTAQLRAIGVLDKRFFGRTYVNELEKSRFVKIDVNQRHISLRPRFDAKVRSNHRRHPGLYTLRDDGLTIHNPEKFWAISRFLVIELK